VKFSLPWAWYLTIPVLVWIAFFMLAHRLRLKRQPPASGEPLHQCLESSVAQIDHQIWLLRNVLWWCLLPASLSVLAWFGQVAWLARSDGWLTALVVALAVLVVAIVFAGVYWMNQIAVRSVLVPRRQELEALLISLNDETPATS
jgi:hypothetical protein